MWWSGTLLLTNASPGANIEDAVNLVFVDRRKVQSVNGARHYLVEKEKTLEFLLHDEQKQGRPLISSRLSPSEATRTGCRRRAHLVVWP